MFPLGICVFLVIHIAGVHNWPVTGKINNALQQILLISSFFIALIGIVFLVFSKEKKEDEYISKLRLESFQIAALVQVIYLIYEFVKLALHNGVNEKELLVFMFIRILVAFWLVYILRYNFVLFKNKYKSLREK